MVLDAYEYWILDLDGTLVDVDPAYARETIDRVGAELGHQFSDREATILWYGLGGSRDQQLADWGVDPDRFWSVFHELEDPAARAAATYLYDDATLVESLDGPVALVTHCQSYLTEPILDRLDIADWFDTVVCCTPEIGWKPDPAPVERARADLDVDPTAPGVLVGDGSNDVGAAWNAGLDAIHVERHDPAVRGQCVLADHRVASLAELRPSPASDPSRPVSPGHSP